jgi:hypothetical protein
VRARRSATCPASTASPRSQLRGGHRQRIRSSLHGHRRMTRRNATRACRLCLRPCHPTTRGTGRRARLEGPVSERGGDVGLPRRPVVDIGVKPPDDLEWRSNFDFMLRLTGAARSMPVGVLMERDLLPWGRLAINCPTRLGPSNGPAPPNAGSVGHFGTMGAPLTDLLNPPTPRDPGCKRQLDTLSAIAQDFRQN